MTAQIITSVELDEYGSRSLPMDGFTDAKKAEAVLQATDRLRQAVLNDYTPESFESLTIANCPDELRELALSVALHIVTRGDANRPASIDEAYDDASRRLGYIAGGKTYYDKSPNAVLVKVEDGSGSSVSSGSAARSFDTSDDCGDYRTHFPKMS